MELDFLSVVETLKALSLGGISLAVLVVILTEVIKEFAKLEGMAVRAVALGLGFALTAVAYGMAEGLIPPDAAPYIEWVFVSVVGGLGGMGLWHLGKRFLSTEETSDGDVADAIARQLQARVVLPPGTLEGNADAPVIRLGDGANSLLNIESPSGPTLTDQHDEQLTPDSVIVIDYDAGTLAVE